jgi:HEPN domain-containing protein
MQDRTKDWIRYAENDFKAAENLSIVLHDYNNAIYHYQQYAEKYVKAVICENNLRMSKTHENGKEYCE